MLWLFSDSHAREMEPLILARLIVTGDHVSIRNIVAETVSRFCPWSSCTSFTHVSSTPWDHGSLLIPNIRRHAWKLPIEVSRLLRIHLARLWIKHDRRTKTSQELTILLKRNRLYKGTGYYWLALLWRWIYFTLTVLLFLLPTILFLDCPEIKQPLNESVALTFCHAFLAIFTFDQSWAGQDSTQQSSSIYWRAQLFRGKSAKLSAEILWFSQ